MAKRVRVLVPFTAPHLGAGAGDVVELDDAEADALIATGNAEDAGTARVGPYTEPDAVDPVMVSTTIEEGNHPPFEPLPVHAKTEPASDEIRAMGASEGGNNPYPEPLEVGSEPVAVTEEARDQLDSVGHHPPFEPLPVAGEDEQVPATDKTGNANPEAVDERIGADYDGMKVAELRAEIRRRGVVTKATKKDALIRALKRDDG